MLETTFHDTLMDTLLCYVQFGSVRYGWYRGDLAYSSSICSKIVGGVLRIRLDNPVYKCTEERKGGLYLM